MCRLENWYRQAIRNFVGQLIPRVGKRITAAFVDNALQLRWQTCSLYVQLDKAVYYKHIVLHLVERKCTDIDSRSFAHCFYIDAKGILRYEKHRFHKCPRRIALYPERICWPRSSRDVSSD